MTAEFNYSPHYVTVGGHRLHYIDEGKGVPFLFLHGVPTYSYLWRNVIPHLSQHARCIALDFLGFGLSDKPAITYDLTTYQSCLSQFIEALDLPEVILVLHGWGSVVGFDYAMKHPKKVKGLVFLESHLRPTSDLSDVSLPVHELIMLAKEGDNNLQAKILDQNFFIEKIFPAGVMRQLSETEMKYYRAPFTAPGSRKAILDFINLIPYLAKNKEVIECIKQYSDKLCQSDIPKLMLYAVPGFVSTMSTVHWAKEHLSHLTMVDIGEALHYPQESQPALVGKVMQEWFSANF